jgi:hypothetical protein
MRNEDDLRAVLQSLERHAPALAAVLPPSAARRPERPRRPARQRPWLRIGGPLLVAVAVVAAVVAPLTVDKIIKGNMSKLNGPAGSVPDHPTAAQVLTAAARVAVAQPAQPGKYWRVSIASTKLLPGGSNAHPYALRQTLSPWVTWYPVQPTKNQWYIAYSDAGYTTTLATPGGAAQWRAAGSPALPSAKLPVVGMEAFSDLRYGPTRLTPAQFQSLPSDPAKLKAQLDQMVGGYYQAGVKNEHSYEVFGVLADLLDHEPITPQVRAAAFRVLAGLPGIQMLGKATDPVGRPGYMIGLEGGASKTFGANGVLGGDLTLVISPATGTLLAEESVATSSSSSSVNGKQPPASGAIPGGTACGVSQSSATTPVMIVGGPGSHRYTHDGYTYCVPAGATVKVLPSGDGISDFVAWSTPHQSGVMSQNPLGPVVSVPPGTVTAAYTILSAGWTDATPAPGA